MRTYAHAIESLAPSRLTGDPLWTVVQYADGRPLGGDHSWVRLRYAERAADLYGRRPELHGKPTSVLRDAGLTFDPDPEE